MATSASHQRTALIPFLLVSVALHLACFQLSHLIFSRLKTFSVVEALPLKLRLIPRTSISTPLSSKTRQVRPVQGPQGSPKRPRQPAPVAVPKPTAESSDVTSGHPVESTTDDLTIVSPPTNRDIWASARREAAKIAREINQSSGEKSNFRSRTQENIDRQFEAAHAAGGAWFRSARIEEITRASDGNTRVYRIVTPLGAFCRTYPANGSQPMNTICPR